MNFMFEWQEQHMLMSAMMVAMTVTRMPPVKISLATFHASANTDTLGDGRNCEGRDQLKLECS